MPAAIGSARTSLGPKCYERGEYLSAEMSPQNCSQWKKRTEDRSKDGVQLSQVEHCLLDRTGRIERAAANTTIEEGKNQVGF